MREIILAPDIVASLVCQKEGDDSLFREAIAKATREGRVWLYTASVESIYQLVLELLIEQGVPRTAAPIEATRRLNEFASDKNWLAALADDGLFAVRSPLIGQLSKAISRLGEDAGLLTDSEDLLQSITSAMSPAELLQQDALLRPIEFLDLKAQQDRIRGELERRVFDVLHHGQYIMGPEVLEVESMLAEFVGVEHCITVASGTDALVIALMALGIGPGDEVITVPYSWMSTAEAIVLVGAKPVFVDIDSRTFNMDACLVEAAITPKTRAIMPVSLYGQCSDMDAINAVATKLGLPVIEDAAQSFGATYKARRSCGLSTIGATSFFPTKPLGCYGDGGALFTNDGRLAELMRQIRVHGQHKRHHHPIIGMNGRLDTLQAAILLAKMTVFEDECNKRRDVAGEYDRLLAQDAFEAADLVKIPFVPEYNTSVYAQYTLLTDACEYLRSHLDAVGIPSVSYYSVPLHLQPALAQLGYAAGSFPQSECVAKSCLSLPISPNMSGSTQERIAAQIKIALKKSPQLIA